MSLHSQLVSASAAISCMYGGFGIPNVLEDSDLRKIITALIKSATASPRVRSLIIPVEPFQDKFMEWPDNENLSVKDL